MNEFERCIDEWAERVREQDKEIQRLRRALRGDDRRSHGRAIMSEEKPTPLQQHIITHGNATFDCGAWDVEDEGRVRYQDLVDHATAARLALEQAITQALRAEREKALEEAAGLVEANAFLHGNDQWRERRNLTDIAKAIRQAASSPNPAPPAA